MAPCNPKFAALDIVNLSFISQLNCSYIALSEFSEINCFWSRSFRTIVLLDPVITAVWFLVEDALSLDFLKFETSCTKIECNKRKARSAFLKISDDITINLIGISIGTMNDAKR